MQLQKTEDSAPDSLEFDRLKDHFEPFIRASSLSSQSTTSASHHSSHATHVNPITAAASAALARDVSGVGRHNPLARSRGGRDKGIPKDEMPEYRSRVEIGGLGLVGMGGGEGDVDLLKTLEEMSEVAALEQRGVGSWVPSLHSKCVVFIHLRRFSLIEVICLAGTSSRFEYPSIPKSRNAVQAAGTSSSSLNRNRSRYGTRSSWSPPTTSPRSTPTSRTSRPRPPR